MPEAIPPIAASASFRPLAGIRVLELCNFLAGPVVGMLLADLGAEVLKVEPPSGDRMRSSGMRLPGRDDGEALAFLSFNRGKRSLVADLKEPQDQALVRQLALSADVLVENLRPGSLERNGLDYAALSADNPGLVYCSVTAFGQDGPYAGLPGVDSILQAISGALFLTGEAEGRPVRTALATADYLGALVAAYGVLAALFERKTTGRGRWVQTSLLDAQMFSFGPRDQEYFLGGDRGRRIGSGHPAIVPFNTYATADGMIMLCVLSDAEWRRCCAVLGLQETDASWAKAAGRVACRGAVDAAVAAAIAGNTTTHWIAALRDADILSAPVNDLVAAFADPQVKHNGIVVMTDHPEYGRIPQLRNPVSIDGKPLPLTSRPPMLGEHSAEIRSSGWGAGDRPNDTPRK